MGKRRYGRTGDVNPDETDIQTKTLRTWQHERELWAEAAGLLGVSWSDFARQALDRYATELTESQEAA